MRCTRQSEQADKEQSEVHRVSLVSRSKKPGLRGTMQSSVVLGLGPQANICSIELARLLHCSDVRKIT